MVPKPPLHVGGGRGGFSIQKLIHFGCRFCVALDRLFGSQDGLLGFQNGLFGVQDGALGSQNELFGAPRPPKMLLVTSATRFSLSGLSL